MSETATGLLWLLTPWIVALGATLTTWFLMRAWAEVSSARDRRALAEARALLAAAQQILEDRVEAAEAQARRKALDEFLADVRIEERQNPAIRRKHTLIRERVLFRNIPLTPWFEHEAPAAVTQPAQLAEVEVIEPVLEPVKQVRRLLA